MSDVIDELRRANPVRPDDLGAPDETETRRLFARLEAEQEQAEPVRAPRRAPRGRRLRLAGAVAGVLVAGVAGIQLLGGSTPADPVAQARAALSGSDGVFHTVTSYRDPGARPVRVETWSRADGTRGRSLFFGDGSGRTPAGEAVSTGADTRAKMYRALPAGASFRLGDPAATNPRTEVLDLLRRGKVVGRRRIEFAGRDAWRLDIRTRRGVTTSEDTSAGITVRVPAHTDRTVLVVDADSHLPLQARRSRVVPSLEGSRAVIRRQTQVERYLRFERLTGRDGAAGLRPSARFE